MLCGQVLLVLQVLQPRAAQTQGYGELAYIIVQETGHGVYSSCKSFRPFCDALAIQMFACFQVCLELVIAVALRNRDRILLIWPLVHDYLAAIMAPEGTRQARWTPSIATFLSTFT
jgi:hypothetical protein